MTDDLLKWIKRKKQFCYLPLFVLWEMWKARNASIFSNLLQKTEAIYLKILLSFSEWNKETTIRKWIICSYPYILLEHPEGFFGGGLP